MAKRDAFTIDLFSEFKPTSVVDRYEDEQVKAWSLSGRMAKAIAITMEESGLSREAIAAQMSEITKTSISKAMLDAYSSPAKEQNQIPAVRLAALVQVTGDVRPLNVLLQDAGLIAIPKKYEALLKRERARELREKLLREEEAADAQWKASR